MTSPILTDAEPAASAYAKILGWLFPTMKQKFQHWANAQTATGTSQEQQKLPATLQQIEREKWQKIQSEKDNFEPSNAIIINFSIYEMAAKAVGEKLEEITRRQELGKEESVAAESGKNSDTYSQEVNATEADMEKNSSSLKANWRESVEAIYEKLTAGLQKKLKELDPNSELAKKLQQILIAIEVIMTMVYPISELPANATKADVVRNNLSQALVSQIKVEKLQKQIEKLTSDSKFDPLLRAELEQAAKLPENLMEKNMQATTALATNQRTLSTKKAQWVNVIKTENEIKSAAEAKIQKIESEKLAAEKTIAMEAATQAKR